MADILVLGAGLTGLSTALLLARDGHRITVLDRDPAPPPPGREWAEWDRPGVAQFRLAHIMLPRWYQQMRADLPDVLDRLAAAGGCRLNFAELLHLEIRDSDSRFETLTARRPVLEAVLAASAAGEPGVEIRREVAVSGLAALGRQVTAVRLGDGTALAADLVVDCTGRRSPLPTWLAAAGCARPQDERDDAGFVYYGRHFRGVRPEITGPLLQHHDSVSLITLPADNDTWSVGFVASTRDHALRALRHPDTWQAAIGRYPMAADWATGEPLTGVDVMAGLADRWRAMVVAGEPVATGVVAVGDAACCTNPSLGRGAAIGLLHARTLRDLLRETAPDEPEKLALRFAERTAAVVEPVYRATFWFDRHRIAEIDGDVAGVPYLPADPMWRAARAVYVAGLSDPELARVNLAAGLLFEQPDRDAAARAIAIAGDTRYPLPGPARAELLAALG
jgi:2-polyprenyl-6-methoxyphenol hydroxylase-like FAD-dependent oxidoreductase